MKLRTRRTVTIKKEENSVIKEEVKNRRYITRKKQKNDLANANVKLKKQESGKTLYKVIKGRFHCEKCKFNTENLRGFISHYQKHKRGVKYKCRYCVKQFNEKGHYDSHLVKIHTNENIHTILTHKMYTCDHCHKFHTIHENVLKRHVSFVHLKQFREDEYYHCAKCNYRSYAKDYLVTHMLSHQNNTYACDKCNMVYRSTSGLRGHKKFTHSTKKMEYHKCELCDYKTVRKSDIGKHMMKHNGKPYSCQLCGLEFALKALCDSHIAASHRDDPAIMETITSEKVSCTHCNYFTYNKTRLRLHMIVHKDDRFTCKFCNETFRYKSQWHRHVVRVHEDNPEAVASVNCKVYTCEICGQKYIEPSALNKHLKGKHIKIRNGSKEPQKFGQYTENIEENFLSASIDRHIALTHSKVKLEK